MKHIAIAIAIAAMCCIMSAAQTNIRVVTAKAPSVRQPTLPKGFSSSGIYNQKVATKPSVYREGNRAVVPGSKTKNINFPLKPKTEIKDSLGNVLGTVTGTTGKINFGARRTMIGSNGKPQIHYQLWNSSLPNGTLVSGYVQGADVKVKPKMPTVRVKQPPKGPTTPYIMTGGNRTSPQLGFFKGKDFVPFKVTKGYTGGGRNSTDYGAARPGVELVNQCLNLPGKGGVCHNAFPVGTRFDRIKSVHSRTVPLYLPGGIKPVSSIKFVLGRVKTPTGPTLGWTALDALKRKK
jgi:hypothetical protein